MIKKILFFATIVFAAISIATLTLAKSQKTEGIPQAVVETTQAKKNAWQREIIATGSIRANQGIMVRSEVAGRVTKIYFNDGDNVTAGTNLIQLNQDILQAKLEENQAALKLAQQDYNRLQSLYKTRTISKADLDQSFATLRSKTAIVEGTKAQVRQTVISAPFSGRVGLTLVDLGDYISAGQDLVSLQSIDPIDIEFAVPEIYIGKLAVGNDITFHSDAYPGHNFTGKIYAINSEINTKTRSVTIRAKSPNKDSKLVPGMFAEVTLTLGNQKSYLLIPQTAIVYDVGSTFVYKVVNNIAVKTLVTLGDRDQKNVVILNGINEGDTVITAGQIKVRDGAPVIVKN